MSNELLKAMIAELRKIKKFYIDPRNSHSFQATPDKNGEWADFSNVEAIINKYEDQMNNTIETLPNGDSQVKPETPNPYHFDNNQILQDSCTPEAAGYYEKQ